MQTVKDSLIGQTINNYQIVSLLGQGGMGRVYRAKHQHIGKQVAIKILKSELSEQSEAAKRFYQEAKTVNDIGHENVVDIIDFGTTQEGEYYLIMELLEGRSLGQAIQADSPFATRRLGAIALQICYALEEAHNKGIVHRDLKPDNIFLTTRSGNRDFVKILDFGLVKFLYDEEHSAKTTTGMVLGTPLYMAPEQALGRTLDAQTDIYALGVILYQMATNTLPFSDPNPVAVATMHVTKPLPPPRERYPNIDPALEAVIIRCLAKEKHERYTSMKAVAADLATACKISRLDYQREALEIPQESAAQVTTAQILASRPSSANAAAAPRSWKVVLLAMALLASLAAAYALWPSDTVSTTQPVEPKPQPTTISQTLATQPLSSTAPSSASAPASAPSSQVIEEPPIEKPSAKPRPEKKPKRPTKDIDDATLTPDFMKKKIK